MGSLYNLSIDTELFGDIVITSGHNYVFVIKKYLDIVAENLKSIHGNSVKLKEVPLDVLRDYRRKYERYEIIVPSFRIDSVVSKLIHKNRSIVKDILSSDNVLVNYEICRKASYILNVGDVISIRKLSLDKISLTILLFL